MNPTTDRTTDDDGDFETPGEHFNTGMTLKVTKRHPRDGSEPRTRFESPQGWISIESREVIRAEDL